MDKYRSRERSRDPKMPESRRESGRSKDRDRDHRKQIKKEDDSEYLRRDKNRDKEYKKKSKRSDSSSTSSVSSADELDKKLQKERDEKILKKRLNKLKMKEKETPEEKRVRRLAKKLRKEEKRRANALPDVVTYTNLNNPFNDSNLTETFVWKKKFEVEGKDNLSKKEIEKLNRDKVRKNYEEMERLKRERDARQALKEDMEMISRDKDRQMSDFRHTEEEFYLYQAKLRSKIRIKEGRAKPIDLLARYITYEDPKIEYDAKNPINEFQDFELEDPLIYLKKCSIKDYEDLLEDIKIYLRIEGNKHRDFWNDIMIVIGSEIKKMRDRRRAGLEETVHSSVQDEVLKIFKGKSYDELANLEKSIQSRVTNAGKGVDVSYWESLLDSLHPFMAKARLKEKHSQMIQLKLKRIREEQMLEVAKHEQESGQNIPGPSTSKSKPMGKREVAKKIDEEFPTTKNTVELNEEDEKLLEMNRAKVPFTVDEFEKIEDDGEKEEKWGSLNDYQLEAFTIELYNAGQYSPTYGSSTMPGIEVIQEDDDAVHLENQRQANRKGGPKPINVREQVMFEQAKQGMTADETSFTNEQDLGSQTLLWSDKYRPQKPKYFNRVHTGYDWNKYNQTHYDVDNPPPKIVQGYRFNIFYPDLLDPTKAPRFTLHECAGEPDFAIIRFIAGPPYEDIAFKIVNKEWEVFHKHGYKCQFANGVFQLWFFFKRYRYRR